jgi:hypothetical protein
MENETSLPSSSSKVKSRLSKMEKSFPPNLSRSNSEGKQHHLTRYVIQLLHVM